MLTSTITGKSPAELWYGRIVNVKNLRSFGCDCYVLIQDHKRAKTEKKSKKGIFVGYDLDSPSYRIHIPEERDVISSDNVIFNESIGIERGYTEIEVPMEENMLENLERIAEYTNEEELPENFEEPDPSDPDDSSNNEQPVLRNLRDRRNLRPPLKYGDYEMGNIRGGKKANIAMIGEVEDISVSDALKDKNWRKAMTEEFDSLTKMKTWKLVNMSENIKPLTCRWILREKQDGRLKARLVARGFEQKAGIDYTETFSPVARHVSIRLILSLAATNKMKLITFDVKTAFLHGVLKESLYMYQPEGFDDGTGRVCKLLKSIYGLKQASKNFNEEFSTFIKYLGFDNTDDDPCIYYNEERSVIIALFVDDGLIAGMDENQMVKILNQLNKKFEVTYNISENNSLSYLSMEIKIDSKGIFVNQSRYTEKILRKFKFDELNSTTTPMERGMMTEEENFVNDKPLDKSEPYREAIGSLLYLATISRPDISFAVNYLSRFCSRPMTSHWKMVRRVFQYLNGSIHFGIHFNGDTELVAYTDSDYGGDNHTGHSTSGVLILLGGPIVWYAQKQKLVATSTAEAEYRAAVSSIDDICWIRRIGTELKFLNSNTPTDLYVDNKSAIHMLQNTYEGKITKGKKHIEIQRKFIQEHIGKTVNLKHIKSSDQLADILTKPLNRKIFEEIRCKIIKEEC